MKIQRSVMMGLLTMCLGGTMAQARPKYIPVVSGLFSMGQWYFEGEKSSLGGNAALSFVPALQFVNKFSVIPTFQSSYRGTRSAEELAGGSTLFQDTWENGASVKFIQPLNERWNLREKIGYKTKWFRETSNESWTNGLYDYRVYSAGTEIERRWGKTKTIGLGYDYSYLQFPNYVSLESQQTSDLAREFSGDNVLDSRIHLISLRIKTPLFWKMHSAMQAYYSPREYPSQHIANPGGTLDASTRRDETTGGVFSIERAFDAPFGSKFVPNLQYGYTSVNSNQNHYDARVTTFLSDFYDYDQQSVGTQFSLVFGRNASGPMIFESGYSYSQRNYRSRIIQDSDGAYQNEKLYTIDQSINLGFSYPITKNFRARTTATFAQSKSNNNYEAIYKYNYHNSNYQFGFTYDY